MTEDKACDLANDLCEGIDASPAMDPKQPKDISIAFLETIIDHCQTMIDAMEV